MTREVNAMPFTTRLNYSVEEISMEEFMAAVHQSREKKSQVPHMRAIEAKINQVQA